MSDTDTDTNDDNGPPASTTPSIPTNTTPSTNNTTPCPAAAGIVLNVPGGNSTATSSCTSNDTSGSANTGGATDSDGIVTGTDSSGTVVPLPEALESQLNDLRNKIKKHKEIGEQMNYD